MAEILAVDDDREALDGLVHCLEGFGNRVRATTQPVEAWEWLQEEPSDLLVCDVLMPRLDGMELLRRARSIYPSMPAILITGEASVDGAVAAIKGGAFHYLSKPFEVRSLRGAVDQALSPPEPEPIPGATAEDVRFASILGHSAAMRTLRLQLARCSRADATVLITGESGVGKELVVRCLHQQHPTRSDHPLVSINCGAIPRDLMEAELFGHVRGAFTGAERDRPGRFELANGGTLFLDEIGTMSVDLQAKLLRVLQERRVTRLGGSQPTELDVRVVAATNDELPRLIDEGRFREDLYYRLNVIPLHIPPLRDRKIDIPMLAEHFLHEACSRNRMNPKRFAPSFSQKLMDLPWRGNVRELENAMEYAAVMTEGDAIDARSLPPQLQGANHTDSLFSHISVTEEGLHLKTLVSHLERQLILQSLEKCGGNKARAAELLHLKRTTFVEKLKRIDLPEANETLGLRTEIGL